MNVEPLRTSTKYWEVGVWYGRHKCDSSTWCDGASHPTECSHPPPHNLAARSPRNDSVEWHGLHTVMSSICPLWHNTSRLTTALSSSTQPQGSITNTESYWESQSKNQENERLPCIWPDDQLIPWWVYVVWASWQNSFGSFAKFMPRYRTPVSSVIASVSFPRFFSWLLLLSIVHSWLW